MLVLSLAPVAQIRRYVYNDVVRVVDMQKYLDTTGIQSYVINQAKVVFLRPRPQPKPKKQNLPKCVTCDRCLRDGFNYCSLGCKVIPYLHRLCLN